MCFRVIMTGQMELANSAATINVAPSEVSSFPPWIQNWDKLSQLQG